jgi:hypothetical protein
MDLKNRWIIGAALIPVLIGFCLQTAQASGPVGNGTPQSCNEAALDAALAGGGLVTFNCGPAPITITIHEKQITQTTTVDGGGRVSLSGGSLNSLFFITTGVTLNLDNLRLAGGYNNKLFSASALGNAGTLVMHNSQVVDNGCDPGCFGAIVNSGALQIYDSVIRGNQAPFGSGAIANFNSKTVRIINSTIADNHIVTALAPGAGALDNRGGTILLLNSTIMSNTTFNDGGAILNDNIGTVVVVNSTLSGNSADGSGGAVSNEGLLQLYNATVTNNQADADLDGVGTGGGISNTGTFEFRNTILAGNNDSLYNPFIKAWLPHTNDCNGRPTGTFTSFGYNILLNYNLANCPISGTITLVDPQLGPLQDNGGPTWTHGLLAGSPAINGGNPSGCVDSGNQTLSTDQRGYLRLGRCDIGAFEVGWRLLLPLIMRRP